MNLISSSGDLSKGGAVLEASDGTKLAVIGIIAGSIFIFSDLDVSPNYEDGDTYNVIFGGGGIGYLDAAIDSNDDIHIVAACISEQTRDIAYCKATHSGGSWTLGTWEQAANYTEQAPSYPGCAISIDSSDNPHIVFVDNVKMTGSAGDNVYYTWHNGSSWQTPEQVGTRSTKTDVYTSPNLTLCPANDIEAFYYFLTDADPAYKRRNGSWSSESVYTEGGATIGGVTILVTDNALRYHVSSANIEQLNVDLGYDTHATYNKVSPSLVGSDRYVFYIDSSSDVHIISNTGSGWTDEGAEQTGTYEYVIAQWSYLNDNQSGEINYLFENNSNYLYYDSFSLSADVTVTPGAVSCIAASQAPTVVLSSVSVSPAARSAIASTTDPTVHISDLIITPGAVSCIASSTGPSAVILGSVSVSPAASSSIASKQDPTVHLGSTTATPAAVSAIASCVDPAVVLGSLTLSPGSVSAIASSTGPTIHLSSTTATPAAVNAIASSVDPTVVLGSLALSPGSVSAICSGVDPTVDIGTGDLYITPGAVSCIASSTGPSAVILGSVSITPSSVSCITSSVAPTIVLGSLALSPGSVTSVASSTGPSAVIHGSISITPTPSHVIASSIDPTVIAGGDVDVTPSPVSCIASSTGPSAVILGSVSVSPSSVSCITSSVAPTVVLGSTSVTPSPVGCITSTTGPVVVEGGAILTIDFEEGTLADFDSTTNGEDLAANNASVLVGTYGMEVTCDDTSVHYGFNSLSIATGEIRFRFYLDTNGLTMASGDDIDLCRIQCDGSYNFIDELCTVILRYSSGNYQICLNVEPDNGIDRQTTWTTITDNAHYIEVLMQTESTDGAADGIAKIWIDGVETSGSITDLENYNVFLTIDGVRFGIAYGQESGTTGSFYLDDLVIRDDDTQIGPAQSSLTYSPAARSAIASSVDPSIIQSSIAFTPGAVSCIASGVDPTIAQGSITVSPFAVSCITSTIDPAVILGSLALSPGSVTSVASSTGPSAVILGSVSITPTPSYALASSVDPTVYIPPLLITPSPAGAIAEVGGLAVDVNGDLYCIPHSSVTIASTVDPTVLEIPVSIINFTLYDRSFSWGELYERSGFFVVFNVLFEDGVIMEFEDGDQVTWGASRSGFSLPERDLDFTLTENRD